MRRDECGAWRIDGKYGSIHTWGDGKTWVLYVGCRSKLHWTATKQRLGFCVVTQDGDVVYLAVAVGHLEEVDKHLAGAAG